MPAVPAPGEYTVCEINRDLLTRKDDADKTAQDAYSKILGRVFGSIPFRVNQPENGFRGSPNATDYEDDQARESGMPYYEPPVPSTSDRRGDVIGEDDGQGGFLSKQLSRAKNYISSTLQGVIGPYPEEQANFKSARFQAVNWHKQKHWLAFLSGDQVLVYDFEHAESREPAVLANDSQRGVEAVEWRPNSGATLSVACRGGICIWSASFPGNIAPVRAGIVSILGTPLRGSGARWALVDFLKTSDSKPVTAISCFGFALQTELLLDSQTLLASASRYDSSITIWDVSEGKGSPLRRGLGGISLLKWSPTGDYLLNGSFSLWETNNWTSEPWSSAGGSIVSAMWGPDGHALLAAFDESTTLAALYFPSRPPSLDVHLLPLELPELESVTGGRGTIDKMAWDGTGERLAVSYTGGDATYSGLIAIYDTRHTPIVSTGFIAGVLAFVAHILYFSVRISDASSQLRQTQNEHKQKPTYLCRDGISFSLLRDRESSGAVRTGVSL
ncbi:hypothetical protein R1sor_017551 [Riccia sorocarpa]|uniref:Uncharacterized protein n=1 Tax=Riccia sorocarpa TaxID=122646 RepID=A0ABD3IDE2_9MARC